MGKLQNIFSWSISRDRLFNDCRRAYYYNYYGAWGGWETGASEFCRKAYLLKNIQGIDAWVGDSVHKVIKSIIEGIMSGDLTDLVQARVRIKEILVTGWQQSVGMQWKSKVTVI